MPETNRPLANMTAGTAHVRRAIGACLFISEYTVDSPVRTVLNKLGFNSRSQIAAWVAED